MGYFNFENNITAINDVNLMAMQKELMKMIFQVNGLPYITPNKDENPADILGFGTWERVKGKVLVGLDEDDTDEYFNEIGKEGGEKKHALSSNELPVNNIQTTTEQSGGATDGYIMRGSYNPNGSYNFGGSGSAINITQPYRVVGYMWIRTE